MDLTRILVLAAILLASPALATPTDQPLPDHPSIEVDKRIKAKKVERVLIGTWSMNRDTPDGEEVGELTFYEDGRVTFGDSGEARWQPHGRADNHLGIDIMEQGKRSDVLVVTFLDKDRVVITNPRDDRRVYGVRAR
mgnify:CR=1 FL=1